MRTYAASASFTRANTNPTMGSGVLIANSSTAGSVVPMTFSNIPQGFLLTSVKIVDGNGVSTTLILHLFQYPPTVSGGDNSFFQPILESGYLGAITVDCTQYSVFGTSFPAGINTSVGITAVDPNYYQIFTDDTASVLSAGATGNIYGLLATSSSTSGYLPSGNSIYKVVLRGVD